jgi:hypothetical protein
MLDNSNLRWVSRRAGVGWLIYCGVELVAPAARWSWLAFVGAGMLAVGLSCAVALLANDWRSSG